MADCCQNCGKTEGDVELFDCQKCRLVAYCSMKCKKKDKENHRQTCKRRDAAGTAPCDICHDTEKIDRIKGVCVECGLIACSPCVEPIIRSVDGTDRDPLCPNCNAGSFFHEDLELYAKGLEELIQQKRDDPRRSQWLVLLGVAYAVRNNEPKAMMYYEIAGNLGFANGYNRASLLYARRGDWHKVKESLEKAAELDDVLAMTHLGREAMLGRFIYPSTQDYGTVQEDHGQPRELDWKRAYSWFNKGARLGDPFCCAQLGVLYFNGGKGVAQDLNKAFEWSLKGAEKGNPDGMFQCADSYENGVGVEQSNEEAIKWLKKALPLSREETRAETRRRIRRLEEARDADRACQT